MTSVCQYDNTNQRFWQDKRLIPHKEFIVSTFRKEQYRQSEAYMTFISIVFLYQLSDKGKNISVKFAGIEVKRCGFCYNKSID